MKQKICGLLAMLLLLSGCGSSTPTDTSPMSEDEITQMYSDPDSFKGRTLELYGRVFNEPEYDDDGVYFQMWGDPENGERNTIVACKDTSLKLQDDDYVHILGSVSGKHEGENALGSKITAPAIVADSVEVVTYQQAASALLRSCALFSLQFLILWSRCLCVRHPSVWYTVPYVFLLFRMGDCLNHCLANEFSTSKISCRKRDRR